MDFRPVNIAYNKRNGNLLVVQAGKGVHQIIPETKSIVSTTTLMPFSDDASSVVDINTNTAQHTTPYVLQIGDIDSSPNGDILVSAYGVPENSVLKIENGDVRATAYSSISQNNIADGPRLLAINVFGTYLPHLPSVPTTKEEELRICSCSIQQVHCRIEF